jgi:low affinity Fe/Cu permease
VHEHGKAVKTKLSFGNMKVFGGVQQALFLVLMLVTLLAVFSTSWNLTYKIGIALIAFAIIFMSILAAALLQAQKENQQTQT